MEEKKKKAPLLVWRDAFLSKHGSEPTTRLCLMGLVKRATPRGSNIYPGVRDVAEATGLSDRSVTRHLRIAAGYEWDTNKRVWTTGKQGGLKVVNPVWVVRQKRKRDGKWKSYRYYPTIPLPVWNQLPQQERNLIRQPGGLVEPGSTSCGTGYAFVWNHVPQNTPMNTPKNTEVVFSLSEEEQVEITDHMAELEGRMVEADRVWVAETIGEGFPPDRVSKVTLASLAPDALRRLEYRIRNREEE